MLKQLQLRRAAVRGCSDPPRAVHGAANGCQPPQQLAATRQGSSSKQLRDERALVQVLLVHVVGYPAAGPLAQPLHGAQLAPLRGGEQLAALQWVPVDHEAPHMHEQVAVVDGVQPLGSSHGLFRGNASPQGARKTPNNM